MLAGSSYAAMMPKASCFIFVLLSILPFSFFCAGVRSRALDMDGMGKALLVAENASPATGRGWQTAEQRAQLTGGTN
jgi:hypothetical protein